jgi:Txe/YoeB family toxin of Txe-Axe toxin-antitoxin module
MDIVLHMSLLRWRMNKVFTENGWADYTFGETEDRKTLKKINKLIERNKSRNVIP